MRQGARAARTAHRNSTSGQAGWPPVVEDGGRQAWLDRAACRELDPGRFFPESGEQVKVAEAKAICAGCQVRDQCLDLAVKAAGGSTATTASSAAPCPAERSRLRGNPFAEAERAFQLAERLGSVNAAAVELGTTWPSLRKAFHRHAGVGDYPPRPARPRPSARS